MAVSKHTTLFFYNNTNSTEASLMAKMERDAGRMGMTRDATAQKIEREDCDAIVFMPDVPDHHKARVEKVFHDKTPATASTTAGLADPPVTEPAVSLPEGIVDQSDMASMPNSALRKLAVQRGLDVSKLRSREEYIAALR